MKRGASRQELNVSFLKEKQLQMEEITSTLKTSFLQTFDKMIQKVSQAFSDESGEEDELDDTSDAVDEEVHRPLKKRKRNE